MTHRLPRFLLYPLAALLPALGLLMGLGSAAGASTRPASPSAAAQAAALAKAAIRHLVIGQHATDHGVGVVSPPINGLSNVQSTNWSGYADTGSAFSTVTGRQVEFSHYFPAADGVLPQDRFDVRYLPQNPWQYRLAGEGDGGELAVAVLWSLVGLEMIAMAIYVLVAGPV